MSNVEASWPPTTSCTVWLIDDHTSAAPSTVQTISTETTVTMPRAMESRNAVFMTDHGSIRVSRSRARRPGLGAAATFSARRSSRVGLTGRPGLAWVASATLACGAGAATGETGAAGGTTGGAATVGVAAEGRVAGRARGAGLDDGAGLRAWAGGRVGLPLAGVGVGRVVGAVGAPLAASPGGIGGR